MKAHKTPRAKNIIQATVIVATITILCKILGFVEKLLLAYYFGTGMEVDAYIVAFSVPFFSFIVLREVLEPAFVPTFMRVCKERDERGGWKLVSVIANALAIGLGTMIIIGLVAAPSLASILAPGFTDEGRSLTIKLIRMILPALLFMGLSGLTTAILHAHKRFTLPAVSEAVFRATPLLFFYALSGLTGLVIGVVIGALAKLTLQTLGLWRRLKSYLPSLDLRYPPVQRVGLLATPLFFGSFLSYLVWPFVDNIFASTLPPGNVSALAFAKKMVETLTLIFPYALGVVIFPFFSELALKTDRKGLSQALTGSLRAMIFICTPITIGLISLRVPIIRLLFERGEFDFASTQLTASPLMYYSLGLIAFSLEIILMQFYFALSDTLTPIIVEVLCFVLNIIMILILMRYLSLGGIALATSLSKSIKVGVLLGMLKKKIGYVELNRFPPFLGQLGLAALVMVVSISLVSGWLNPLLDLSTFIGQALHLSASLGIGGTAFLAAAFLTGVDEMKMIPQRLLAGLSK